MSDVKLEDFKFHHLNLISIVSIFNFAHVNYRQSLFEPTFDIRSKGKNLSLSIEVYFFRIPEKKATSRFLNHTISDKTNNSKICILNLIIINNIRYFKRSNKVKLFKWQSFSINNSITVHLVLNTIYFINLPPVQPKHSSTKRVAFSYSSACSPLRMIESCGQLFRLKHIPSHEYRHSHFELKNH